MEDKPISLELPNNIECIIESTDAAIKKQTAFNLISQQF